MAPRLLERERRDAARRGGWRTAGGEPDLPPAGEQADEPQSRPDLPDAAAALSELGVGHARELVAVRLAEHPLQALAGALLPFPQCAEALLRAGQARGELVAARLELAEREQARTGGRRAAGGGGGAGRPPPRPPRPGGGGPPSPPGPPPPPAPPAP